MRKKGEKGVSENVGKMICLIDIFDRRRERYLQYFPPIKRI
jgi:hypothetical protein